MNIAIDGRQLNSLGSGFKTYTTGLISGLQAIDSQNDYFVYLDRPLINLNFENSDNFKCRVIQNRFGGFIWKQIALPIDEWRYRKGIDIFHFLSNSPSYTSPGRLIYTIHDLSFLLYPGNLPRSHYLSLRLQMPLGARRAEKIITESQCAKKDICRFFQVDPKKVQVIYGGVDESYITVEDKNQLTEVQHNYNLPNHFILYLGSFLPHKNLFTLLRAYARLPLFLRNQYSLVLGGNPGKHLNGIMKLMLELDIQERVILPGYVSSDDIAPLYSLADIFVYPSLYEGFGLPPLEAMACGTPVVVSNSSSIPEVVGDAGLLVDPQDIAGWSAAIEQVLSEPDLRAQMRCAGLIQADKFKWAESAKQTLAVYEEVASA